MKDLQYFETGSTDPAYNLAFEEYLLEHYREGDLLILWQNDRAVICGAHQNVAEEVDRKYAEKHGIEVVRRMTGGGAVYHDLGNLNYSFLTDRGEEEAFSLRRFTAPVVEALGAMGLSAEASGKNDILVEGQKVSGTAQRVDGDRILHHGTLLFDSDLSVLSCVLTPKKDKFQSKSTKSVRSRVGNLRDFLPEEMTLPVFWDLLREKLAGEGATPSTLSDEERAAVEALAEEKYRSFAWNYGRSPACKMQCSRRTDGGTVEVFARIENGCFQEIQLFGDFMARKPVSVIEHALTGVPVEREALKAALDPFDLTQYFGTISQEELISLLNE